MPAPVVNGGGDRIWKWKEFKLWRARDLDLDLRSGHTAYRPASVIDHYLYTKFHSNWRNFLWTDGRTYGRTDISPLYIIRSTLGSRPKNKKLECWLHTTLCKCAVAQNQLQTSQECWAACTCREPAAGQREVLASMHMQRTSCRPVGSAGWRARAVMMQVLITIFVTWLSKNINVNICYYDCHKVHRKRTGHACILKAAINFQQQRKTMSPFTAHIPLQPR